MEPIFVIAVILVSITLLKIVFKLDTKKVEPLKENKELEKLTDKFPENVQVAREMLKILGNDNVKIEEAKNTGTSLYIAITNKISIADMKNNYARLQTIAHECLHSVQDRRLLLFNFIFSNIIIIYWLTICILTALGVINNIAEFIFLLLLMATLKLAVRQFLEVDAMTKAKYLAEKYIKSKKLLTEDESNELLEKYEEINKVGIPFTTVYILAGSLLGILIYAIIGIIF